MEIIAITGSPHGNRGNTAGLLRHVLAGAEALGAATQTVHLAQARVLPCRACGSCHQRGHCPHDDEFESLKRKIIEADAVVLASPVFILHVPAQMKAFIDRCSSVIHCLAFRDKVGASVVTSGGGQEEAVARYLNRFLLVTGVLPVGYAWATMGGRDSDDLTDVEVGSARALGARLVRGWQGELDLSEDARALEEWEGQMRALVQSHREDWPFESEYWEAMAGNG